MIVVPENAFDAALIVFSPAAIVNVWTVLSLAEIDPSVVAAISIFVIDLVRRVVSCFHFPDDAVSEIVNLADTDHDVTMGSNRASNLTAALVVEPDICSRRRRLHLPRQNACVLVIEEQRIQSLQRRQRFDVRTSSYDSLLSSNSNRCDGRILRVSRPVELDFSGYCIRVSDRYLHIAGR